MTRIKIAVCDCGNINAVISNIDLTHLKLLEYVKMIRNIAQDSIIIVIGGTDDLNYPVIRASS